MEKSQLKTLIFSFPAPERREIRKFLESPFFNQRRDVVDLFDWLCTEETPDKVAAKRHLFGAPDTRDEDLRVRMTYLTRLLERYIAQKEWDADDTERQLRLAEGLRRRRLFPQFDRTRRTLEKRLEQQPRRDARYHEWQYRLHWEAHQVVNLQHLTQFEHLHAAAAAADAAYLALKLRFLCLSAAQTAVYQADYQPAWEQEVVRFAEQHDPVVYPALGVYLHCYRMMRYPDQEVHFQHFKQALLGSSGQFAEDEVHGLFIWAINYCVRRINAGQRGYFAEALDLYKAGLESRILLDNGVLSRFTYHNVVAAGLHTGDHDWVLQFIHQYKNDLEKPYRESAFSFNLARLEFARKRYHEVLNLLQKANYRDVLVNLSIKTLLLKTWYELDEHDLLQSHLDAMQNYIRRKRVLGYHRANYLNILKYTTRLLTVRFDRSDDLRQLREQVQQEPYLTEKEWLLEKLA